MTTEDDFGTSFRRVPGFPAYCAGTDGSVWTCWRKRAAGKGSGRGKSTVYMSNEWKRIRVKLRPGDYPRLGLKPVTGKSVSFPLHTIILITFIGPQPEGMVCRHLDGNRHNNELFNLTYGTSQENAEDAIAHGTVPHGESHSAAKLDNAAVLVIRAEVAIGTTLDTLAERFHVNRNAIWMAATRKTWKHVGDQT